MTVSSAGSRVGWRNRVLTTRLTFSESIFLCIIYILVPVGAERRTHRKKRNHVGSCAREAAKSVVPESAV